MKTNLAPKLIHDIDNDTTLLWFHTSNRYVVTSKINSDIIQQYTNPDFHRDLFVAYIHQNFDLKKEEANQLFDDIATFLNEVNQNDNLAPSFQGETSTSLTPQIEEFYTFFDKTIKIRFESEVIKSLVHPQIAHHSAKNCSKYDALFDIFKTDDNLHLLKNGIHVGSYKTESFHFLQGRFALELTNTIHNTLIDNWIAAFHASTVSNGKESIMIIGDSGNGKSTLSVLLMAHGFDILCDDFTPLYEDDKLYRYPAATSIKKGAFEALKPYLSTIDELKTHTSGPKKVNIKYVPPIQNYEEVDSYFSCNKIVYVKFDAEKDNTLHQISSGKILEILIPDSWISPKETHAIKFINWLKQVSCYELRYHNNDFAISKFKDLFEES